MTSRISLIHYRKLTIAVVHKVPMTGISTYTLTAAVKVKVVRNVVFHSPVVYPILLKKL